MSIGKRITCPDLDNLHVARILKQEFPFNKVTNRMSFKSGYINNLAMTLSAVYCDNEKDIRTMHKAFSNRREGADFNSLKFDLFLEGIDLCVGSKRIGDKGEVFLISYTRFREDFGDIDSQYLDDIRRHLKHFIARVKRRKV